MGDPPENSAGARYVTNAAHDSARAGLMDAAGALPEGVPSHWRVTFGVEDVDSAIAAVREHGGSVLQPAHDSPHGRHAVVADPQGAPFAIIEVQAVS